MLPRELAYSIGRIGAILPYRSYKFRNINSSSSRRLSHEHNLARYASLAKELMCLFCLSQGKSLCDERLDFLLLEQLEQDSQVLSKPFRFQPFERLYTVGDYSFPAREKPASRDIEPKDSSSPKALATARTA